MIESQFHRMCNTINAQHIKYMNCKAKTVKNDSSTNNIFTLLNY